MALPQTFPKSPFEIIHPDDRYFPADEQLRGKGSEKLIPPLVDKLRRKVHEWRENDYQGATDTTKQLLTWWFKEKHLKHKADGSSSEFRYFFAQREAVETICWLIDVAQVKDKYDLPRFDAHGVLRPADPHQMPENWRRFITKMATGSGKTKVLSLVLAWSYFHKMYEEGSPLARNFLVIAPNIIVLDRIRTDFDGLKIFFNDPVLPDNGWAGHNWRDEFQLTLHIQDQVRTTQKYGNIFLTNIHRVYENEVHIPSYEDQDTTEYFLGAKVTGQTNDRKVDLAQIVRDIDELVVLNDEAHHVHDEELAWFKSIQDIHNRLVQKGSSLALQLDVTATPKHNNGALFPQIVSDYPLVEAIYQNIVKHPLVPDSVSRARLKEKTSAKFSEMYEDFLQLGYEEWKKVYEEHKHLKKAVLFIMVDDTKNCDEVAEYLERTYPDLQGAVLTIHTKRNGDISESISGKDKDELEKLRKQSNEIDSWESPFKVIVSVLMLKEGWDVKNVTTIVGLRPFAAESKVLPEQTLGRGLRKMYSIETDEYVSVIGTPAFMEFVESISAEGVILDPTRMGGESKPKAPMVVDIDRENPNKDLDALDIAIPILSPRIYREYKNLSEIDIAEIQSPKMKIREFSEDELREIVFRHVVKDPQTGEEIHHKTVLSSSTVSDYRSVVSFLTTAIMRELRLFSGFDVLYGKVLEYLKEYFFERPVQLEDPQILRHLSEAGITMMVVQSMKDSINSLTIQDKGEAEIRNYIKVSQTKPFAIDDSQILIPQKSVFNRIVGDSIFELEFAQFLERASDVRSFIKNYAQVNFKIDYVNANGNIAHYYPDFVVKLAGGDLWIVETKGLEDLDDNLKFKRLLQWCDDVNKAQNRIKYAALYIKQEQFEKQKCTTFSELIEKKIL